MIDVAYGRRALDFLSSPEVKLGEKLTYKEYEELGHSSGIEEMRDLGEWLKSVCR